MSKGIDVSFWNGLHVNWQAVKSAGYDFAYIKASEGTGRIEPNAITQDSEAILAGLKVGYYHFAHLGEDNAATEAALFDQVLSKGDYQLIPVVDVETNKSSLAPAAFTQWIADFVSALRAKGHSRVMIYAGTYLMNTSLLPNQVLADCPLWLADYEASAHIPHGWSQYVIWQNTDKGQIPGINGAFDVDLCPDLSLITL